MVMAAAAGAAPIGAGWGYHDAEELIAAGAIAIAASPVDVIPLIAEHARG
jgi:phosphoglycolate phosphatase